MRYRCAPSAIISACSSGWSASSCCRWCCRDVTLTAWRGYRTREPVAILLSTSVIVPFLYFFWKSLTLAGRRHLADVHVADRLCRHRHQHRDAAAGRLAGLDDQIDDLMGENRDRLRHRPGRSGVPLLCRGSLEFHRPGRSDRRRGGLRSRSWSGRRPSCRRSARPGSRPRTIGPMRCCAGISTAACR